VKWKWLGIAALLCLFATPFIARFVTFGSSESVEVTAAANREIASSILASGHLTYQDQAQLSPEVIGKVTGIFVKEGDYVKKGQVVLQIYDDTYKAAVDQLTAAAELQRIAIARQKVDLAYKEANFQRYEALYMANAVAKSNYDDELYALNLSRADLRNSEESLVQAEAILSQSKKQLALTTIQAPMTGTVIALNIKLGETAVPSTIGIAGSNLLTIADTDSIRADIDVDEADIARVKIGQKVVMHVTAYPDRVFTGKVLEISLSPQSASGTELGEGGQQSSLARNYAIKATVENPRAVQLRSGMTCRAEIYLSTSGRSLAVPIQSVLGGSDEAVQGDDAGASPKDEAYVFVIEDGVAHKHLVQTGLSDDEYQQIAEGLKPGDLVVSGPYKTLRLLTDGERVSIASGTH
jgi:HlyD family secretion protein